MSTHLVDHESLPINSTIQSTSGNGDAITTDTMEELGNTPSDSTTVSGRDENAMELSNEIGDAIDGGSAYDTDDVRMAKDAPHDAVVRFDEHNDDGEERKVGTSNDSESIGDDGFVQVAGFQCVFYLALSRCAGGGFYDVLVDR